MSQMFWFFMGAGTVCLVGIVMYCWGRYIERSEMEKTCEPTEGRKDEQ